MQNNSAIQQKLQVVPDNILCIINVCKSDVGFLVGEYNDNRNVKTRNIFSMNFYAIAKSLGDFWQMLSSSSVILWYLSTSSKKSRSPLSACRFPLPPNVPRKPIHHVVASTTPPRTRSGRPSPAASFPLHFLLFPCLLPTTVLLLLLP